MTILRHVTVIIASTGLAIVVFFTCVTCETKNGLAWACFGLVAYYIEFCDFACHNMCKMVCLDLFCTCQNNERTYCCFYCCGVLVTLSLLNSLLSVSTPLPPPVAADDEYHPPPPRPRPSLQPQAPSRPQRPSSHSGHSPRPTYVNTHFIIS